MNGNYKEKENPTDSPGVAAGFSSDFDETTLDAILQKAKRANEAVSKAKKCISPFSDDIKWDDNANKLDKDLLAKSEGAYIAIVDKIVESAVGQLRVQNKSKNYLKKSFTVFFIAFLSVQYLVLAAIMFIRSFQNEALLSDAVIITYTSSVFVETLSAVVLMIKYAFDGEQETNILSILNSIIKNFQKFLPK